MTANAYVIIAYVAGLGLLFGYAAQLWLSLRAAPTGAPSDEAATGGRS